MRFSIVVAAAFALAPVAYAEESGCPLLQRIVGGAPTGFVELRDEELSAGWFESRIYLDDADDCSVNIGDHNLFYCAWEFDAPAPANDMVSAISEMATQCLSAWAFADTTGEKSSNNFVILKGITLSGAGSDVGTQVSVFSESVLGSQQSRVSIEVRR
jgi:hypothetical protein